MSNIGVFLFFSCYNLVDIQGRMAEKVTALVAEKKEMNGAIV